jgi:hypothetical protein
VQSLESNIACKQTDDSAQARRQATQALAEAVNMLIGRKNSQTL